MARAVFATAYGGPENLSIVDVDLPVPGPGQITAEPRAIGVNPIDSKLYSGAFGEDPANLPMPIGLEFAGVVTAVGPEARGPAGPLAVGDEVVVHPARGAYATAVNVSAAKAVPKPPGLAWESAGGMLLAGSAAVHLLSLTGALPGRTLLIHGVSGAVGLLAAQLALLDGAHVVGTASGSRSAALRELGITPVEYGPGLAERVRAAAPSEIAGALDAVGTDEAVDTSLEFVAPELVITTAAFHRVGDGITAVGSGPGADPGTEIRGRAWERLLPLAAEGRLRLPIGRTFPLAEAAAAHRLSIDGHPGGKIVLLP